jgi:hypothetical protein
VGKAADARSCFTVPQEYTASVLLMKDALRADISLAPTLGAKAVQW